MSQANKRSPARVFSLIAAACVAAMLVGSLIFVFHLVHQSQNPPSIGSNGPQWLYTSDYTSVFKLNPQTHQVLWQREIKSVIKIIPAGHTIYILQSAMYDGEKMNAVLELDASSGKTLWTHLFSPQKQDRQEIARDMNLAQGRLYIGWQGIQGNGNGTAQIYVLNISDGSQISAYPVNSNLWTMVTGNGILVVSTAYGFRVYDLATGKSLWNKSFTASTNAPVVSLQVTNGLVYAVVTAHSGSGSDQSTIQVYKASSGASIWQSPAFGSDQLSSLTVDQNIVYFGVTLSPHPPQDAQFTAKNKQPTTGLVYAYDIQSNKKLWSTPVAGATLHPLVLNNGVLYFGIDSGVIDNPDPQPAQVVAINAATGHIQWRQTLAANYIAGFCLGNGAIYASTYKVSQSGIMWIKTYALNAANGNTQWEYGQGFFTIVLAQ